MTDKEEIASFYAPYDKIATAVASDPNPRNFVGVVMSHIDLMDFILTTCKVKSFDIFDAKADWQGAYDSDDVPLIRAYHYKAYLLYTVCTMANKLNVGTPAFTLMQFAIGEYWSQKLLDKLSALTKNEKVQHRWIN